MTESDLMFTNSSIRKLKSVESVSLSVFDKLTDELLIDTLIRLPLKPANLCKCISTRFRSLISSSYFVRCYTNHHQLNKSFALYYQTKCTFHNITRPAVKGIDLAFQSPIFKSLGFSLSFLASSLERQASLVYLASHNGLILCRDSSSRPVIYLVCNPLTKQFVSLPPPPSIARAVYTGFVCYPQFKFNDDDGQKEGKETSFKVVRIEVVSGTNRTWRRKLKLEIFCSVSGRWTVEYFTPSSGGSDGELFYIWNYRYSSAVVCDGLLHWDSLSTFGVFTYDPFIGECRIIELPGEIRKPVWTLKHCLGESSGRLRYASFSPCDSSYRVWELKDCNTGEWWLLHKVRLDEMNLMVEGVNKDWLHLLLPHPLNEDIVLFWCRSSGRIVEYLMGKKLMRLPCFIQDVNSASLLNPLFFPFVLPSWPTAVPAVQQHDFE